MPDLETAAVSAWLREHETVAVGVSDGTGPAVAEMPEVVAALKRCGSVLDDALAAGTAPIARLLASDPVRSDLQQIMAQLGIGWSLRMIGWITAEGLPDADAIVARLSDEDPTGSGQFLHASLAEAARPALMSRLFAPERLTDLLTACSRVAQKQEAA